MAGEPGVVRWSAGGVPHHTRPGPVELRPGRGGDAGALAELFWRVREENAATIPRVVHPRGSVLPFLASEGAPDLRMQWMPARGAATAPTTAPPR